MSDASDDDGSIGPGKAVEPVTYPTGLRGDMARLFSAKGTVGGRPSIARAVERAVTRPGPLALLLYRVSHGLWTRRLEIPAEVLWRLNLFLTGADIHPGAMIGGGLRLTHTSGIVIGAGAKVGSNVTILHGVTLGGSARGWFRRSATARRSWRARRSLARSGSDEAVSSARTPSWRATCPMAKPTRRVERSPTCGGGSASSNGG
jgi:hypothetical protein